MLLRHTSRFVPTALLLLACGQSANNGSNQQPTAGEGSGAMSGEGGTESAGGSTAGSMSSGNASSSDAGATTGGTSEMMPGGGDAGQAPTSGGTAGDAAGGAPNGDAGAAGNANEAGSPSNGGTAGANGGSGGYNSGGAGSGGGGTGGGGTGGGGGAGGVPAACNDNDVRDCYTGPEDARGKGACKQGTQTCTNGAWGACTGDVQPEQELCDDGVDNDCDGLKDNCSKLRCTVTIETQSSLDDVSIASVARDSAKNAIVTGHFSGTADFGGKQLVSNGKFDFFLAKYSPECELIWAESFGSAKYDNGFTVAVAPNDDIVAGGIGGEFAFTGDTGADVDLGGGLLPHTGPAGAFLARYDKDGKHIWSHLYGGNGIPGTRDIAFLGNGDIVIAANGGGDYGGGLMNSGTVVARYTSGGDYMWSTLLGYGIFNGINTAPEAIAVDSNDRVLVSGSYDAGKSYINGAAAASHNTAYLSAVSSDGKTSQLLRSARTIYKGGTNNTTDPNIGNSVAAFGTTLFWAGYCVGPIDFGGGAIPSRLGWDAFVASYDGNNKHLFSFLDGDTKADIANDIALDSQSNVTLVGQAWPIGVFVRYSSGGRWLSAQVVATPYVNSVAVANDDSVAIAGSFNTTVDLGNGTQTPIGGYDGFLSFYDP